MKETSGEFSMTVVVIIGAIIVVGILTAMGPFMGEYVRNMWDQWTGQADQAGDDAANAFN